MTCNLRSNESGVSPKLFPPVWEGIHPQSACGSPSPWVPLPQSGLDLFPRSFSVGGNPSLSPRPLPSPQVLALDGEIRTIAEGLAAARSMLVMGRGYQYGTCLEGALVCKKDGGCHSWVFHSFIYFLISFCPAQVWWRQRGEDECARGGVCWALGPGLSDGNVETWAEASATRLCPPTPSTAHADAPLIPLSAPAYLPPLPPSHTEDQGALVHPQRGDPLRGAPPRAPRPRRRERPRPPRPPLPLPPCPQTPKATGPGRPAPWVVAKLSGGICSVEAPVRT